MTQAQKPGTNPVTFQIPLRYEAARPPVKWATSPDEIEPWDWTRGKISPYDAIPETGWSPGGLERVFARARPAPPVKYYRGYYEIGRLAREHPWEIYLPPQEAVIYRHLGRLGKLVWEERRFRLDSSFARAIPSLVSRIGLLDPHGLRDSFNDWWIAAIMVHCWLEILKGLNLGANLADVLHTLEADAGFDEVRGLPRDPKLANPVLFFTNKAKAALDLASKEGVSDPRTAIAHHALLRDFYASTGGHLEFRGDGYGLRTEVVVRVGASTWALYELAGLYGAGELRACANQRCGVLFAPKPKHARYCSRTCQGAQKMRRYRSRQ